ncbi:MAG: FAD-dependent oxidoreductase [Bacillota bacterium]|jgi:2,4-dienoyl-CoA reductase-like NADH-dependent reductase (Old Yellow Enzyme family)/thioredoxin reductase
MSPLMKFETVFSPIKLGKMTLKNRLVMSAMSGHMSPATGHCTKREVEFYRVRAAGGVGLVIVGAAYVREDGGFGHGQLGIYSDEMIPGLSQLAEAIKAGGARASIQLHHAGRQTGRDATGLPCVAPSGVPWPPDAEVPQELTLEGIADLVECYGQAARRAMKAGFEAVEIHSAHGYLPAQFLSRHANRRQDRYGGSFENRTRFMREVYARVRSEVGPDVPITVRVSGDEFIPMGITLDETLEYVKMLDGLGVDGISVSSGCSPYYRTVPNMVFPVGLNAFMSERVRAMVSVPVIVAGRVNTPELAEDILRQGKADLICLGRPLISDPEYPRKAATGRAAEIRPCIACNKGCHDRSLDDRSTKCVMNPAAGREETYSIPKAKNPKKVAVVGGGPAGMEAALVAAEAGHEVTLYEASDKLGGRLILAAIPPAKAGYGTALEYLRNQIRKSSVTVKLNTKATIELLKEASPDSVVFATGASPMMPAFKGISGVKAVSADDVLAGRVKPDHNVLVIGGGAVGSETCHYLGARGHRVTLIEMTGKIGSDMAADAQSHLVDALRLLPTVKILTRTKLLEFQETAAICECDGKQIELDASGTVVVAVGAMPNREMLDDLKREFSEVYVVGDAVRPRDLLFATRSGADAARNL